MDDLGASAIIQDKSNAQRHNGPVTHVTHLRNFRGMGCHEWGTRDGELAGAGRGPWELARIGAPL